MRRKKKRSVIYLLLELLATAGALTALISIMVILFDGASILESLSDNYWGVISILIPVILLGTGFLAKSLFPPWNEDDKDPSVYSEYLSSKIGLSKAPENGSPDAEKEKKTDDKKEPAQWDEETVSYPSPQILIDKNFFDGPEKTDIFAQMLKNTEETNEYFKISKSQAKQSHTISLITCIAGVVLLFVAIVLLLFTQRVDLAAVPAVSGAIAEAVSGTVLWVYNKSIAQLNHYYDALHENERYLSLVNLVSNISQDKQDMMYIEIIRSQLNYITQGSMRSRTGGEALISPTKENSRDKET